MELSKRIQLLIRLGHYLTSKEPAWEAAKRKAFSENNWFIPEFIELSARNIAGSFLSEEALLQLAEKYSLPSINSHPLSVGIVMAGNVPLVGFHDLLCVFISGHRARIKPSSKDDALIRHLIDTLKKWDPEVNDLISVEELLKNCDAYIATGSNNSSRYFDYYFSKYPSIIRKNRTSAAILTGKETEQDLERLADDVYQYFGLGCRNVTKLFVPQGYDFIPLLRSFEKYNYLSNHHKYKNNYDYNLAMHILNNRYYMTNGSIVLVEDPSLFSAIAQLHYEYYADLNSVQNQLQSSGEVQCVVGSSSAKFGSAQLPGICDFADGVDTMSFLMSLCANIH